MTVAIETFGADKADGVETVRAQALDWLSEHAETAGVRWDQKSFGLHARMDGRIVGALVGSTNHRWVHVELLAVDPVKRRCGVGRALLERAEAIGRERQCIGVWLDTYDFQGPTYYPRLGYREMGRIEDMPPGHVRIYFTKRL